MDKTKKLAKNTIILFLGTFCTKLATFLLLPLYTGILSTSEYGVIELLNTLILLLIPIILLHLDQGVFRYLIDNRENEKEKNKLISTSFFFTVFSNLIVFFIFLILCNFINSEYKWLFLLNLVLNGFSTLLLQITRGLGNNKEYSISNFIITIITIMFNILFLVQLKLKVEGMLFATALGYFAGIVYIFVKLRLYENISLKYIDKKSMKTMLNYSLPMIPNSLSWWVFSSSDRFIVSSLISLAATGILSVSYKFSTILIVIYNVFNMSITESLSLHIREKDISEYYNRIVNIIGQLFITLGMLILAFMPILFRILINIKYIDSYDLIPIAVVASILQVFSGLLGTIYIAKNNTKSIANTSIFAAIINVVVDFALIKYIGVYAAVVSTVVSFLVLVVYRYVDACDNYFKIKFDKNVICNMLVLLLLIIPIYYSSNTIIIILGMLISIISAVIFNNRNFFQLIKLIKQRQNKKIK